MIYKGIELTPSNCPGPGDEETWGPCVNHPGDPRTPDRSEEIEEHRMEMFERRLKEPDFDWLIESLSESAGFQLDRLANAVVIALTTEKAEHFADVGRIFSVMCERYVTPSEEEALEDLNSGE